MSQTDINQNKKRKNTLIKVKNAYQNAATSKNNCSFSKTAVSIYAWVKTLVLAHDAIPNIINLIDKMVAAKATNAFDGSTIFGDHKHGTFNQVEQVLEMENRKISLINIYTIIETMVNSLSQQHQEFVRLKYYKRKTMQYISQELEIDERTAFRWSNIVINKMVDFCTKNNWTEMFFMSQTKEEPWLREQYNNFLNKLMACVKD